MKNIYLYILLLASTFITAAQQQRVSVSGNGFSDVYDFNSVDSVRDNGETKFLDVEYPIDQVEKITFSKGDLPLLNKEDKATAGNRMERFYFTLVANKGRVLTEAEGVLSGNTFSVYLPYVTDFSSLVPSFKATGAVYVEDVLQKSGVSAQDFSSELAYKVLSSSGDVNTYHVKVYNSGLPVVRISTSNMNVPFDSWSEDGKITIRKASDNSLDYSGSLSVKCKGSRYSTVDKHSFNLKMASKALLLGMSKGKRWILLSNYDDKSLLRAQAGFFLGSQLQGLQWTPKCEPVELVLGDRHLGTYLLCEQIRVSDGRVADGYVWEVTDDFDATDVHFRASRSGLDLCSVDPEVETGSSEFLSAQQLIADFESALYGSSFKDANSGYRKYIDVNSFVDWYLVNEIGKNKEAAFRSDCYFNINADGKIVMGPIYSFEDFFGNASDSYEGYAVKKEGWIARMFEDPYFVKLVADRWSELSGTRSLLLSELTSQEARLGKSVVSNESLWNNLGVAQSAEATKVSSFQKEVDGLKKWIDNRYAWLDIVFSNELKTAKAENAASENQIASFSFKYDKNGNSILKDYEAKIEGDSIKLFIPYLVRFDMVADFSVSSGASVYVDGIEQESGRTINSFLHPLSYKVVSSNGSVRSYSVKVYNSGLPVVYINTEGNRKIEDKVTWLDNTSMMVYWKDGSVNYDAAPDMVQIKGRGNSTWDTGQMNGKSPYAIRLNKKSEVFGMLEHKRWVLMANYYDATFFRNELANYLAKRFTNQDWVPSGYSVELVLNGEHKGNYYFCEQAKINDSRVPGSYMVEADTKEGKGQMQGQKSQNYFNTKDPELETNTQEFQYVKEKLDQLENAIFSDNFTDPNVGYKKYVDLESFVDWYMIKELSKDIDGNLHTSCFFHIMEDGMIKMGPLWDFDLAFGGNPFGGEYNQTSGYWITKSPVSAPNAISWFGQLMKDPEFVALLKVKLDVLAAHMDEIEDYIDSYTDMLALSASANTVGNSSGGGFGGFGGFGGWGGTTTTKTYAEEVAVLKTFLKERLAWLRSDLSSR